MKNNLVKRITVLAAVAVMGMSMAACGNKAEEAVAEEAAVEETAEVAEEPVVEETAEVVEDASTALTDDEYVNEAAGLVQAISDTMTQAEEELSTMDASDIDAAKEFIEGLKAPFVEFAAVEAPEKFVEAQEKFKSGCEGMVEYLDICIQMMDMEDASEEDMAAVQTQLTDLLTTLQTDLVDAGTLMDELTGGVMPGEEVAE